MLSKKEQDLLTKQEKMKKMMARITGMDEEMAIDSVVADMWQIYDTDDNGALDYEEVKGFC